MNEILHQTIDQIKLQKKKPIETSGNKIRVNESVGKAAFFYEKLRNALDYQDEHLFLKNAIKRILKRRTFLGFKGNARMLLHELVWARYFENDTLPVALIEEIDSILRKYNFLKENAISKMNSTESMGYVLGLAACEIEEHLSSKKDENLFISYAFEQIKANIKVPESEMDPKTQDMHLEIALRKILFKEDYEQIRYEIMRYEIESWPEVTRGEMRSFAHNFDELTSHIDNLIKENRKTRIFKFTRKNAPPFIVLWDILKNGKLDPEYAIKEKILLAKEANESIAKKNKGIMGKVYRAIVRGIIFILMTKVVIAFAVELPFELRFYGEANYVALTTNTLLPPLLMFITSMFIRIPGPKNTKQLSNQLISIVEDNDLNSDILTTLKPLKARGFSLFNSVYISLSFLILLLSVWALISLSFNVVSIILFFFFVSLVSFLAFRIRSTAKELEVKVDEDSFVSGIYNFLLLPFVIMGKFLSDKWSDYNFTLLFWDFVIEAPFKAIIAVFEAWFSFTREKREDFE